MDTCYLLLLSATVCISTFVYLYLFFIPFTLTHHLPYTPCYFTIERGSVHLVRVRERVSHKPFTTDVLLAGMTYEWFTQSAIQTASKVLQAHSPSNSISAL